MVHGLEGAVRVHPAAEIRALMPSSWRVTEELTYRLPPHACTALEDHQLKDAGQVLSVGSSGCLDRRWPPLAATSPPMSGHHYVPRKGDDGPT